VSATAEDFPQVWLRAKEVVEGSVPGQAVIVEGFGGGSRRLTGAQSAEKPGSCASAWRRSAALGKCAVSGFLERRAHASSGVAMHRHADAKRATDPTAAIMPPMRQRIV
jgi:hypothetical protein